MADVSWTKDQMKVIGHREGNLLVSAAAGSGKTAVLAEHVIRRILDPEHPAEIERMLVMTFTRSAAAELRDRIRAAIEKALTEHPGSTHLEKQAVMVQYAQITTIDSFCRFILREYFEQMDLDPAFRVADEGEILLLKADVMEELLEDRYRDGGEEFARFADAIAPGKTDGDLPDLIGRVYTCAQSNPWPEEWLAQCRERIINGEDGTGFLLADVRRNISEWIRDLEDAEETCSEGDGPAAYADVIAEDIDKLCEILECGDYESMFRKFESLSWTRMPTIRKTEPVDPDKKEAVKDCRDRIKKSAQNLQKLYFFDAPGRSGEERENIRGQLLMLIACTEEFAARFAERKKEKNVIDFNDMEHFALNILMEGPDHVPGPVADDLAAQFDEILVDEYQDSNLVQECLINAISGERFGRPDVFMVGDVKQSIYKFRLARPELFMEKNKTYGEDGPNRKVELHLNFRSRAEVLEPVNDMFRAIMTEDLGGIAYDDDAALNVGAEFKPLDPRDDSGKGDERRPECRAELLLADTKDEIEAYDDMNAREIEAFMIARRIRELTDPEKGLKVWDKNAKCYRTAGFGDIVILLRSLEGWTEPFTEILGQQGVPAVADSRTGYFDTREVSTILSVLRIIDNPMQDIPLAAALMAPFGGLDDREMAEIAASAKNGGQDTSRTGGGFYAAVQAYMKSRDGKDAIRAKLAAFLGLIAELRRDSGVMPMHALLYKIYDRTGYYLYVSALPGGAVRKANLDMLVEKASAFEQTSYRGIFHFIRYIEKLRKYQSDFGEAQLSSEQKGAVRLVSIHKSKGLEFPIVFVAGLAKRFNKQDLSARVLIDTELGLAMDYVDTETREKGTTLLKNVMRRRQEQEQLGEELRILYVALTRAKEKLILTAAVPSPEEYAAKKQQFTMHGGTVPSTILLSASGMLDWVFMSMKEGSPHLDMRISSPEGELKAEMERRTENRRKRADYEGEKLSLAGDAAFRKRLDASWGYAYPRQADISLNAKVSVSELKAASFHPEEEETAFLPTIPRFMEGEETQAGGGSGSSGSRRGTAYHRILSLIPMDRIGSRADMEQAMDLLVTQGKIEKEMREMVSADRLFQFLACDLGRRAAAALGEGRLFREQQFVIGLPAREIGAADSDETVLMQGIIDAFFEEDGELILYDYKTDHVDRPEVLLDRYRLQLDLYARALERITGKKVREKWIYSFGWGEIAVS